MELERLFLKKEELPILYRTCFQIPIHPKLLNPNLSIDKSIAQKIFPEVAEEWFEELKVSPFYHREQFIENPFQNSHVIQYESNGLVTGMQISRDYGGNIYFDEEDNLCRTAIPNQYIRFSKEKIEEFKSNQIESYALSWIYSSGNVDEFSGALFLRNWAIKYMNEVFKQVFR